ncbi:hypothetical protein N032_27395 (plasmid) [Pseudomonas syringae pv. pisi str. PP1]|nr:hypothetical protein N032_27395 [Pseudomonas syringae pv. pisi str. PP1]PYD24270.1 hypothetical protein DND67_29120 [Pseudomonas syringae pv. pisi]
MNSNDRPRDGQPAWPFSHRNAYARSVGKPVVQIRCLAATTKIDITQRIDIEEKVGIGNEGGMPGALETGLLCLVWTL